MILIQDTIETNPQYWEVLKQRIWDILDFDPQDYSNRFLQRRIESRMRYLGIKTFKEYAEVLISDRTEARELLRNLTIHVTHFFRDNSTYEAIEHDLIPELLRTKRESVKNPIIRIWSAGCSSGEEPISCLIAVLEALKEEIDTQFLSIIGTDRDQNTIKKAKSAIYSTFQFTETKEYLLERYFEVHDDENFKLKSKYIKFLSYEVDDITKRIINNLDIILCRNTVIYFETKAKMRLYERFYDMLNPGGFFIMGKTEVLLGPAREKFEVYDHKERIFRKPVTIR